MSASRRPLVTVGLAGLAIIGVGTLLPFISPYPPDVTVTPLSQAVFAIVELLWLASAVVILARQPDSGMWRLLLAGLATSYVWTLYYVPNSFAVAASEFLGALAPAVFVHIVLAFPSGRLRYRIDHALVTFVYSFVAARAITLALTRDWDYPCAPNNCTRNPFLVWENNEFAGLVEVATSLAVPVIGGIVLIALWRHWRGASHTARRALGPVVVAALITYVIDSVTYIADSLGVAPISIGIRTPLLETTGLILPAGFLLGALRLRLTRSALTGAVVELGGLPTPDRLEDILRRRLGDANLQVVRWSNAAGAYLDRDGRTIDEPGPGAPQALAVLERDGTPEAAILLDATFFEDPGLMSTVQASVRMALDASQLRDELYARGGDVAGLPTGEVTFLFGDIEGSTALLERLGPRYASLLAEFRQVVTSLTRSHDGRLVDARADEVFVAFRSPSDAVAASVEIQRRIVSASWPGDVAVRLRIGLHAGRPDLSPSGYVGLDVHRAARVMAAAHGGQIIASASIAEGIDPSADVAFRPLGRFALRGLSQPTALFQVEAPGLPTSFPPPRAEAAT